MKWLSIFLFSLIHVVVLAQDGDAFQQANTAYKAKDYASAISIYEGLITQSLQSKELYHNLANAYYQSGNNAKAILNYERALKINPGDTETLKNLAIANEEIELQVIPVPDFFLAKWWRAIAKILKPNGWVILQLLAGILFVIGIYLWRFTTGLSQARKGSRLVIAAIFSLPFFYLAGGSSEAYYFGKDKGVMMIQGTLLEEPHDGAEELETLPPGVKMRLLDKVDEWYQVSLLNKEQGWVKVESVDII